MVMIVLAERILDARHHRLADPHRQVGDYAVERRSRSRASAARRENALPASPASALTRRCAAASCAAAVPAARGPAPMRACASRKCCLRRLFGSLPRVEILLRNQFLVLTAVPCAVEFQPRRGPGRLDCVDAACSSLDVLVRGPQAGFGGRGIGFAELQRRPLRRHVRLGLYDSRRGQQLTLLDVIAFLYQDLA